MEGIIFDFNSDKNLKLKSERGVSFEDIISIIEAGGVLDIVKHSNPSKYPNQKIYIVDIEDYVYLVPFVRNKNTVFLKTIFASRKGTKRYLSERKKVSDL